MANTLKPHFQGSSQYVYNYCNIGVWQHCREFYLFFLYADAEVGISKDEIAFIVFFNLGEPGSIRTSTYVPYRYLRTA